MNVLYLEFTYVFTALLSTGRRHEQSGQQWREPDLSQMKVKYFSTPSPSDQVILL
jgi:hypothetical protein